MRLIKPSWLAHRDENRTFEVFSLDVSKDGRRLVSGGLDSKVKVWDCAAVRNPSKRPRLLASMAAHTGAVTAVKFSPDNRFIASGSDDRIVLISELDASRQPRKAEFGQSKGTEEEKEVWTPRKRLVGHDNDVQDLAWSPDGQLLVSVGLDSSIIVWSGTTFEKLNRLDWHNSHVKGVAFDPANKFFVTCSDDRSARIVRYSRASPTELSFSVEAVVQHAFVDSPLTSYFRRCSWSPDGECIACPNATNGPIPTVAIIDRGQWTQVMRHQTSLVGHEGTTEVAKFSPRMYKTDASGETCIVATAGEDGCVAIWNTANPRPVVVIQNVATKLITDLAWDEEGLGLFCSSLDGSVVLIEFGKLDLGEVLGLGITHGRLEKYGNATDLMDIPQSVQQVIAAQNIKATALEAASAPQTEECRDKVDAVQIPEDESSETKTEAPITAPPNESSVNNDLHIIEQSVDTPSTSRKQRTTITKDGRRRVAPTLLTSAPQTVPAMKTRPTTTHFGDNVYPVSYDRPSTALPPGGISTLVIGNKRRADDEPANLSSKRVNDEFQRPVVLNPSTTVSQLRLSTPRVVSHISSDPKGSVILEARNGVRQGDPTRVQVLSRGVVVFVDFVPEYITLLAGSAEHYWVVASDNGVVYVYTPQGSRALPPLVLGAPVSFMESTNEFLALLTATGMLFAYDICKKKALFPPQSIAPCLDVGQRIQDATPESASGSISTNAGTGLLKGPQITHCRVTNNGEVMLSTSIGSVFHFDRNLQTWQRICEGFWAYGSRFWDSTTSRSINGPLALSEQLTNEEALLRAGTRGRQLQRQAANRGVQAGYQGFERAVSLSHLSNRIVSADALSSATEFDHAVLQYVRELSENGDRLKLGEIFRELRGNDVLQQALAVAAEYKGVQTLVAEYR